MKKTIILCICVVLCIALVLLVSWEIIKSASAKKLIQAVENEDVQEVNLLLEKGVNPNTPYGFTNRYVISFLESSPKYPLSVACRTGNLEIVKLLQSYGATPANWGEYMGWSPLAETLFYYHPDDIQIVQLLLENGADISQKESDWLPAFRASRMYPQKFDPTQANGTVFSTDYDKETANGITEIFKLLLGDLDVNDQTSNQTTFLMNAAMHGNQALVEYLLSIEADASLKDAFGKTAYDYAIENGHAEIAELLQ